ncbi:MAG: twin-arginine translocation signal domain-containing protein [Lentisphaerae bacterium]|jgi:hypothetical protein|nr:twin-arginine translocation signal domain-containing protein [Lentisphaerota bacterium]MBT4822873.1 twin-arginine translocation signal domain-containing protein [Lentisphaerota bacterium]MBT5605129.1 twin-arginine translocation signal domain-containing protein [Lentisphaerota bacterium]MBT7059859.1 twin-arginine translocation signal domain-containing protein [Lentisphaerota bacterium]MBT7848320.1 twin-arginine translocation signal domain-containing protein [Lentisphaerota bacterium]
MPHLSRREFVKLAGTVGMTAMAGAGYAVAPEDATVRIRNVEFLSP